MPIRNLLFSLLIFSESIFDSIWVTYIIHHTHHTHHIHPRRQRQTVSCINVVYCYLVKYISLSLLHCNYPGLLSSLGKLLPVIGRLPCHHVNVTKQGTVQIGESNWETNLKRSFIPNCFKYLSSFNWCSVQL